MKLNEKAMERLSSGKAKVHAAILPALFEQMRDSNATEASFTVQFVDENDEFGPDEYVPYVIVGIRPNPQARG